MCHLILIVAVAAAVVASPDSVAQQTPTATRVGAEEQRVLSAEDEYVAAEVRRDEQALRGLVDDKFVQNSSNGTTSGKEELIRAVLNLRMLGQTVRECSVLSSLRDTSTYVKRNGQWRMLALQMQQRSQA